MLYSFVKMRVKGADDGSHDEAYKGGLRSHVRTLRQAGRAYKQRERRPGEDVSELQPCHPSADGAGRVCAEEVFRGALSEPQGRERDGLLGRDGSQRLAGDGIQAVFQASYDFLKKRYGMENVVSAWVHMDEKQPHMHFAFVPVVRTFKQDRKNPDVSTEWLKVSAKECVNRSDLQSFHGSLQRYLERGTGA